MKEPVHSVQCPLDSGQGKGHNELNLGVPSCFSVLNHFFSPQSGRRKQTLVHLMHLFSSNTNSTITITSYLIITITNGTITITPHTTGGDWAGGGGGSFQPDSRVEQRGRPGDV